MINVSYSPVTEQFTFTSDDLHAGPIDIVAGLDLDRAVMPFIGFRTGYSVTNESGQVLAEDEWPKPGITYVSTDQSVILEARPDLLPGNHTLKVWFANLGMYFEAEHNFVIPIPPKPFESWSWSGSEWQPPTPKPGVFYRWDEPTISWIALEGE